MLPDEASACLDQVPLSILVRLSFLRHAREQLFDPRRGDPKLFSLDIPRRGVYQFTP